jgi:hypothetical protein
VPVVSEAVPARFRIHVLYHDKKFDRPSTDVIDAACRPGDSLGVVLWPWRPGIAPLRLSAATLKRLWRSGPAPVHLPRRWHTYRCLTVITRREYEALYRSPNVLRTENN